MSEAPSPDVHVLRDSPSVAWDPFVASSREASSYHHTCWIRALAQIFGYEAYYLEARDSTGTLVGILPLIRQKSLLFGDRLVSLPFVNYGGAVADCRQGRSALMEGTIDLARSLRVDEVEVRDATPPPAGWACRTDKATLKLELPDSVDELYTRFGSKLRSQIKRAARDPYEVRIGSSDLLADFYPVFSQVMHELGTPVYPCRFFTELIRRVPGYCTIVSVRRGSRPVAAAFLVGGRDTLEVPWAATLPDEKPRGTNMLLYAEVLKLAVQRGYGTFDFGRSTVDSGPYRFKLQWGARPIQLHWAVWPDDSASRDVAAPSTMRSAATRLWSRLPLPIANRLGPLISPGLPW